MLCYAIALDYPSTSKYPQVPTLWRGLIMIIQHHAISISLYYQICNVTFTSNHTHLHLHISLHASPFIRNRQATYILDDAMI
ncbi:hypothetical protein EYC84_008642 [Monilinia fructicola]|uniref:Uncharacterized protein n=1 Tax=Monilinia fructicola TaxID=38448 RepID=A0A5M9JIT0_MONFR|nr:hypothetical protein EYC84_008642 [Monilinia fructicola]